MTGPLVLVLVAALGAPGAPAALDVASDSSCPSADLVLAALEALGGGAPERRAAITVRTRDDRLFVDFVWAGDAPPDVRELPAPPECGARAQAAAVVAASWLGMLPAASLPAPPADGAARSAPPAAAAAPTPVVLRAAAEAPAPPEARSWWLGVGLGAGTGGGVAPGARVELARAQPASDGFGWIAAAQIAMPRSRTVGGGTSSWTRPAVGLAGQAGWRLGGAVLAADLGALVGLTFAWGSGYANNNVDQALTWGLSAGLRLQLVAGPSRPWVEIRVVDWLRAQRLRFDTLPSGPAVTADLPALEALLTLGWSLPVP